MFEQLPIEYFVGGEKRTQIIEIVSVGGYHPIEYEELLLQDKSKEIEEYVYVVIFICDHNLYEIYLQLFTSVNIDKYQEYDTFMLGPLDILRFKNTYTFEDIIKITIDFIKFVVKKNEIKNLACGDDESVYHQDEGEYEDEGVEHQDEDEYDKCEYKDIDRDKDIAEYEKQKEKCAESYCEKKFEYDSSTISKDELIKVDIDETSIYISNFDLKKYEKVNYFNDIQTYLNEFKIPEINQEETYKEQKDIIDELWLECYEKIELLKTYIINKKLDDKDTKFSDMLVLLENNEILLKDKLAELETISSVLLEKDSKYLEKESKNLEKKKRNDRIISLDAKIKELLKQDHDDIDFTYYNFEFISKWYKGYTNMIATIKNENIVELECKIPLLEDKEKLEREKEKTKFLEHTKK